VPATPSPTPGPAPAPGPVGGADLSGRRIRIFDTTLRDGEQAPGNAMDPHHKLDLALAIEHIGVDVVEAGFPSSSPAEQKAVKLVAESLTTAHVATLNRPVHHDIQLALDLAGTERHHLQIMATGSDIHLQHKRNTTRAHAHREVVEAIAYAKNAGAHHITLAIEDATRGPDDLLQPLITDSITAGADTLTIADTTGCTLPIEYAALIARIRTWIPPTTTLATHCHEDMGLSLANALAAITAGADEIQTTLAGIGERAGNTALEELITVLTYKHHTLNAHTTAHTQHLYTAYQKLRTTINLPDQRNKAILGTNAFATQAGIHQAGILRAPITYEYIEPHRYHRERTILIGRHSGRAVIRHLLTELGQPHDKHLIDRIYTDQIATRNDTDCITLPQLQHAITTHYLNHQNTTHHDTGNFPHPSEV
jgi:2-isopropylmalate synthase